jgi:hypothetical protein
MTVRLVAAVGLVALFGVQLEGGAPTRTAEASTGPLLDAKGPSRQRKCLFV